MKYEEGVIYHIYNRGINRGNVFFDEKNYHYFLGKMRKHLKPSAHILAYCLMPNHFHWLITPTLSGCELGNGKRPQIIPTGGNLVAMQRLSTSIGTLLSSYTQGINRAYGRTGSLFAQNTPVDECYRFDGTLWQPTELPGTHDHPVNCFYYIHQNPVKAGFVDEPEEWAYSSALDYSGWRNDDLCSYQVAMSMLNIERSPQKY